MSVSSLPSRSFAATSPWMASRIWVAISVAGSPRSEARVRSMSMASSGLGGFASIRTSAVPPLAFRVSAMNCACLPSSLRSGPTTLIMMGK